MGRYAVFIVLVLGCVNALSEKEWRAAILQSYADWTMSMNSRDFQRTIDLYTEDCSEMAPGHPARNKQEFPMEMFSHTPNGYLGYDDLLLWCGNFALARHTFFVMQMDGQLHTEKGVRLFVVDNDGQVKIKDGAYNSYFRE